MIAFKKGTPNTLKPLMTYPEARDNSLEARVGLRGISAMTRCPNY
jgi:hypothetical protein